MRADTQRKSLGFQGIKLSHYRSLSICATTLLGSQEAIPHTLVFQNH
jgi:hypothetical protein